MSAIERAKGLLGLSDTAFDMVGWVRGRLSGLDYIDKIIANFQACIEDGIEGRCRADLVYAAEMIEERCQDPERRRKLLTEMLKVLEEERAEMASDLEEHAERIVNAFEGLA